MAELAKATFDEAFQMYCGDLTIQQPVACFCGFVHGPEVVHSTQLCPACGAEHFKDEPCPRCNPSTKDTRCCKCLNAEGSTVWGMDGSLICGSCLDDFTRDDGPGDFYGDEG